MKKRPIILGVVIALLFVIVVVKHGPGLWSRLSPPPEPARADATGSTPTPSDQPAGDAFVRVQRPGSVDLAAEYDLAGLTIPKERIHTLLQRDAIPALTNPSTTPIARADALPPTARILYAEIAGQTLGVPLVVLDRHEVVNASLADQPIALTYCPLCDSATAFHREVTPKNGAPIVLEFGVSGALYNSNVLLYDRTHRGLWSQLAMAAVSGPLAGTQLDMLPARITTVEQLARTHPDAQLVLPLGRFDGQSPYASYFNSPNLMVPVHHFGSALPAKTLGIGIAIERQAWFVPAGAITPGYVLQTPAGPVHLSRVENALRVDAAPASARTAQTFYYAWSAFYPETIVVESTD